MSVQLKSWEDFQRQPDSAALEHSFGHDRWLTDVQGLAVQNLLR